MSHSRLSPVSSLLGAFLAVLASVWVAVSGLGAANVYRIENHVERALVSGVYPDEQTVNEYITILEAAREIQPYPADVDILEGQLFRLRGIMLPHWSPLAREMYGTAAQHYRAALQLRPTSALGWAGLAASRSVQPDLDHEFFLSFDNALVTGAWEPGAQDVFFRVGMRQWHRLPVQSQNRFKEIIRGTLRYSIRDQYIINTAVYYGWEGELSPLLLDDAQRDIQRVGIMKRRAGLL